MKTLKRAFENIFTRPTRSDDDINSKDVYRAWDRERRAASHFGPNHVAEIDAIFSRSGY